MNIFAAGTFFHPSEPESDCFTPWLTAAILAAGFVGSWAFVGAIYALGRAAMAVAGI